MADQADGIMPFPPFRPDEINLPDPPSSPEPLPIHPTEHPSDSKPNTRSATKKYIRTIETAYVNIEGAAAYVAVITQEGAQGWGVDPYSERHAISIAEAELEDELYNRDMQDDEDDEADSDDDPETD